MTADSVGGVWSYAADLSRELTSRGFDITLLVLGPAPSDAQRATLDARVRLVDTGLDLDWLAPDATHVRAAGARVAALCREAGVELVHLNQPALAAAGGFATPIVVAIHSCVATWWDAVEGDAPLPDAFAWQTALVAEGLRRASAVIAPSHAFAAAIARRYGLAIAPLVVWNGRRDLASGGQAPIAPRVFTAGRLWDRGKNIAGLDRIATRLSCPLDAAGPTRSPGGEHVALQSIHALGNLDEEVLAAVLEARPIFVSAARYEPFGLAVLEAARAGCALVLSDIPTFRELWDGAAALVSPEDEDGFVVAIERLLGNAEVRRAAGAEVRRRAGAFSLPRCVTAIAGIYADVLAERAAA